jgi:uncharacterized membrane protein
MAVATTYPESTYFTPAESDQRSAMNVSDLERLLSALAGGGLIAAGALRGSFSGVGLMLIGGSLVYRGVSGHCMLYQALGIDTAGYDNPAVGVRAQHGFRYEQSLVVQKSPEDLFRYWRRFENLPQVMHHLTSVSQDDERRSHWVAEGPLGKKVEWDAEIINERPNELIAWRSLPGSEMDCAGSVHFEELPANRGTVVRVSLKYDPPGGQVGASLASLLGAGLEQRVDDDLERFKQMMEAGEVATVENQPRGACQGV